MCESLKNRQAMPAAIGDVDRLGVVLNGFDPHEVYRQRGDDWQTLFDEISSTVRPSGRMQRDNPRSYWVIYCKGALDGARYLSQFADLPEFNTLVSRATADGFLTAGLPMMIAQEIHGLGFPLACDFLKELGWSQFAKPDVHIKTVLSSLRLSDDSDYQAFKTIVRLASLNGQTPYDLDKVIWLSCSGRLYELKEIFATDRDDYIRHVEQRLVEAGCA